MQLAGREARAERLNERLRGAQCVFFPDDQPSQSKYSIQTSTRVADNLLPDGPMLETNLLASISKVSNSLSPLLRLPQRSRPSNPPIPQSDAESAPARHEASSPRAVTALAAAEAPDDVVRARPRGVARTIYQAHLRNLGLTGASRRPMEHWFQSRMRRICRSHALSPRLRLTRQKGRTS